MTGYFPNKGRVDGSVIEHEVVLLQFDCNVSQCCIGGDWGTGVLWKILYFIITTNI